MSYTKRGPFVNASPTGPWVDADFFNNVEATLAATANSVYAPSATGVAATDTANLTAAITTAQAAHVDLIVPGGAQRYVLTTGLRWDISRGSLLGVGQCDLDFTALTTGYALDIIGSPSATATDTANTGGGLYYSHRPITNRVSGLRLQGPMGVETNTADGVVVRADPTTIAGVEPAQGSVERLMIRGFRDGLIHGSGSFLIKNEKIITFGQWRRGISLATGTLLGENISFIGCTTSTVKNSTGTGVGVYTDPAAAADAQFFGCSFDYDDIEFDHNSGDITLVGCHLENNSPNPMIQLASMAGGRATSMTVLGGTWNFAATGAPRDHGVEVKASTTNDAVTFTVIGGSGGPEGLNPTFFVNNSTTFPAVTIQNFPWYKSRHAGTYPVFGDYLSVLANGNFNTSTSFVSGGIGGWTGGAVAGVTRTIGTTNAKSGNAITIVGTGTAGTDATHQAVAIPTGRPIAVSADVSIPVFTAGSFQVMVVFYGADRATVLNTFRVSNSLTAVQAYQTNVARMVPPQGAAFADVQLQAINWNGTVAVDNVQLTVL